MRYTVLPWIVFLAIIAAFLLPLALDVAHALNEHADRINDLTPATAR